MDDEKIEITVLDRVTNNGAGLQTRTIQTSADEGIDIEFGVIYNPLEDQFEYFDARKQSVPPQRLHMSLFVEMYNMGLANVAYNSYALRALSKECDAELKRRAHD